MENYPPTPSFGLNFGAPAAAAPRSAYNAKPSTSYAQDEAWQAPARSITSQQADSYTAFQQNHNVPVFSAAAVAAGIPPLPIFPDWTAPVSWQQGPPILHTPVMGDYGLAGNNPPFAHPPRNQPSYSGRAAESNTSVLPFHEYKKNPVRAQETEEGELSEGEFDSNAHSTSAFNQDSRAYDCHTVDPYKHDDEYEPAPAVPEEDDDAYSPVASPMPFTEHQSHSTFQEREPTSAWQSNGYSETTLRGTALNFSINTPPRTVDENRMDMQSSNVVANKSPAEVLKLAENAVLNLMPAKVSFQDYLDEGVSRDLVKRIFDKLRLPQTPFKINDSTSTSLQKETQDVKTISKSSTGLGIKPKIIGIEHSKSAPENATETRKETFIAPSTAISKASLMEVGKATKAEERKDRIARLMAEKANKQPPATQAAPLHNTSPAAPAIATQSLPKIDKEKLLRQKMEALQKSREARAAKLAQDAEPASNVSPPSAAQFTASSTVGSPPPPVHQTTSSQMPVKTPLEPQLQQQQQQPQQHQQQKQDSVPAPTVPSIPGLFLASTASPLQSPNPASTIFDPLQSTNQRKRPVASDFDEPTPSADTYKRLFGHSRQDQRLVIDVSEEEDNDEESDMDIDEPSDDSCATPILQQSSFNTKSIRDQPPLTDVPSRKSVNKTQQSRSSPSTPQASFKPSPSDEIKRREQAIIQMRKKIEEAEAKMKAKQAQSGTQTPRSAASSSGSDKHVGTSIAQKVADSVRIERLIDDASRQVDMEKEKLADEQKKAAELQRVEVKHTKVMLQTAEHKILETPGNAKSRKLAELQAEMARHDAAIQRGIEEKARLAEEMQRLGEEADEQLQADTNKLHELEACENSQNQTPSGVISEHALELQLVATNATLPEQEPIAASPPTLSLEENVSDRLDTLKSKDAMVTDLSTSVDELRAKIPDTLANGLNMGASTPPDQGLEIALQNASAEAEEEVNMPGHGMSEEGDMEMEESYAPNPEEFAPAIAISPQEKDIMAESPGKDVQERMFYDSNLHHISDSPATGNAFSGTASTSSIDGEVEQGESDDYEPPEATPPAPEVQSWANTPAFSSLEATPPAMVPSLANESKSKALSPVFDDNDDASADDIAGFEQPDALAFEAPENSHLMSVETVNSYDTDEHHVKNPYKFFAPYESPLKQFKAYRFHPKFREEVSGGFRSLTYSHRIQQDKVLCRYELAGGICNDSTCDMQHFRELSIPDDMILIHLGDSTAYSASDKPNFIKGLREVLEDLKVKRKRDFETIAAEIAAFRSRFLNDSSRVLTLDTQAR